MTTKKPKPLAKKRIVIVDGHQMMGEALQFLVNGEPDMMCAGIAASIGEALILIESKELDLLTVDIALPGRNGLELIKDALAIIPELRILAISRHDEMLYTQRVLRAGARGYITKDADTPTLLSAMRHVLSGGIYVSDAMNAHLMEIFLGRCPNGPAGGIHALTDRELEVFQLVAKGLKVMDISDELNVSRKTTEVHRINIRKKLGLVNTAELYRYARSQAECL